MKKTYVTVGRTALEEFLMTHPDKLFTVEELCLALYGADDKCKSSLYRQLSALCEEGRVRKDRSVAGGSTRFQYLEQDCDKHLHQTCLACGRVEHLDCHATADFFDHLQKEHGFRVMFTRSMLYGICTECQKEENANA